MSINQLIEFIRKYKIDILSMAFLFGFLGVIIYILFPSKYIAVGNIFVSRNATEYVPEINTEFNYEGFYAQQNAASYTSTVIGLLESENLKYSVLEEIGVNPTTTSIKKLDRGTKAKKAAAQLIELEVKDTDAKAAIKTWNTIAEKLIVTNQNLNTKGDPLLNITVVDNSPIVLTSYKNPFLNFGVGWFLGAVLAISVLSLQELMAKESHQKAPKK